MAVHTRIWQRDEVGVQLGYALDAEPSGRGANLLAEAAGHVRRQSRRDLEVRQRAHVPGQRGSRPGSSDHPRSEDSHLDSRTTGYFPVAEPEPRVELLARARARLADFGPVV